MASSPRCQARAEPGDFLDRLGLSRGGIIAQAAQILHGTRFRPDYPQGMFKMGRFRGNRVTGDIIDNRIQVRSLGTLPHGVTAESLPGTHRSMPELLSACGRPNRTELYEQVIRPLLERGMLALTIPDLPGLRRRWSEGHTSRSARASSAWGRCHH